MTLTGFFSIVETVVWVCRKIFRIMKTRFPKFLGPLSVLWVIVWTIVPMQQAISQPRPTLGLRFVVGQPTLSLTGVVGTVYSIQYATNVTPSSGWVDRTFLQAQTTTNIWT